MNRSNMLAPQEPHLNLEVSPTKIKIQQAFLFFFFCVPLHGVIYYRYFVESQVAATERHLMSFPHSYSGTGTYTALKNHSTSRKYGP